MNNEKCIIQNKKDTRLGVFFCFGGSGWIRNHWSSAELLTAKPQLFSRRTPAISLVGLNNRHFANAKTGNLRSVFSGTDSNKTEKAPSFDGAFLFWWERVDSNHRSRRQQIYSLPPLATREHSHIQNASRIITRTLCFVNTFLRNSYNFLKNIFF